MNKSMRFFFAENLLMKLKFKQKRELIQRIMNLNRCGVHGLQEF